MTTTIQTTQPIASIPRELVRLAALADPQAKRDRLAAEVAALDEQIAQAGA